MGRTCTRVKVLGVGRMCYLYMCEGYLYWKVWGACVTCTCVKVLGVGRKSYLYTCTCTRVKVLGVGHPALGVGRMCYLYTCEGAGCGAHVLPVHV